MQCPRCGLQNSPGISACARCGLPVLPPVQGAPYVSAPPPGAQPPYQSPPQPMVQPPYQSPPQPMVQPPVNRPPSQPVLPPGQPLPTSWPQPGPPPSPYLPPGPSPYGDQRPAYGAPSTTPWASPGALSTAKSSRGAGRLVALTLLGLGGLLSLAYALWAFTARRGIFADFADGQSVSVDDAKSSDRLDTVFLVVAGLVALVALALWMARRFGGQTGSGLLDKLALALTVLGAAVIVIGLFLTTRVADAGDRVASGDRGVTAAIMLGSGFGLLGIGLLLGLLTVLGGPRATSPSPAAPAPAGYQGW